MASFQRKPLYAGVNGYLSQLLRNGVIPTKIATREPFSCLRPGSTTFSRRDEVYRVEKLTMPLRVVLGHLRGEKNIDRYIFIVSTHSEALRTASNCAPAVTLSNSKK